MRRDLETLSFFFVFGFFFFENVRKERKKPGKKITRKPSLSLPNVRVGRLVVVGRVGGAEEARADGGEKWVDLVFFFLGRGRGGEG